MTPENGNGGGNFDALLEELTGTLAKAMPTEEPKVEAPAGEAEDGDDPDKAGKKDGDGAEPIAKSFKITLEDGTEVDAVDGAELVKSLIARVEKNEAGVGKLIGEAVKVIGVQGDLIKSLQADVAKLSDGGKGRKAVLTIAEKPAPKEAELAKSETTMTGEEFMAKALSAQTAGRINGTQVAIAEAHINNGKPPPRDILAAVLAS